MSTDRLIRATVDRAKPIRTVQDLNRLIQRLGKAQVVMLGESSHGTAEFYAMRRSITQRLIAEHGFKYVAIEGDWPDSQKINEFILGLSEDQDPYRTLHRFYRWPTWMWANSEVVQLMRWLRKDNDLKHRDLKTRFFGLDIYSLFESVDLVVDYLEGVNPFLARQAKNLYSCFDPFARDEIAFARSVVRYPEGCEDQVLHALQKTLELRLEGIKSTDVFNAQQNARIVKNAEHYYRMMVRGDESTWNIRDQHMLETLDEIKGLEGKDNKIIVWAHNSHVGDYRATDMMAHGSVNLGGLARQKYGSENVALVGFGTNQGQLIAAEAWDAPYQIMNLPAAKAGSYENAFHEVCQRMHQNGFHLIFDKKDHESVFSETYPHRAVGVVYNSAHEVFGNYVPTSLSNRYDAFIFLDKTTALEPIHIPFKHAQIPETWPSGM